MKLFCAKFFFFLERTKKWQIDHLRWQCISMENLLLVNSQKVNQKHNEEFLNYRHLFTDIVDPDLVNIFSRIKDNIVTNISEDHETCIQKLICQAALSEDPWIQNQILKW